MSVVSLSGVWKGYSMGDIEVPVLKGVDLDVDKGGFIGLFGPSGSGKTTLLNLIAGIDEPDKGRIIVNGHEITTFSKTEMTLYRRREVGYIFQFYNLLPTLTAVENIELALELDGRSDRRSAERVLRDVGLAGKEERFPSQLSGGEQQRVAIARAIVREPSIIVGDEPTGNLDRKNSRKVVDLLQELNRESGITILVATHDHSYEDHVTGVRLIENGRVVGQ